MINIRPQKINKSLLIPTMTNHHGTGDLSLRRQDVSLVNRQFTPFSMNFQMKSAQCAQLKSDRSEFDEETTTTAIRFRRNLSKKDKGLGRKFAIKSPLSSLFNVVASVFKRTTVDRYCDHTYKGVNLTVCRQGEF